MDSLELGDEAVAILNALPDGVTVYDRHSTLIWLNDRACVILGGQREDFIGRSVSEIATLPSVRLLQTPDFRATPRSRDGARCNHRSIAEYSTPGYMEFNDGTRVLYVGRSVFEHGDDELVRFIVYVQRDVTALDEAQARIDELEKLSSTYRDQLEGVHQTKRAGELVYASQEMRATLRRASKIARLGSTVFLCGESGVGKNMLARYIHRESTRADGPFIQVNCAALPESLIEAELFGYTKGTFTGGSPEGRRGLVEIANGGTLFLDEITEMPLPLQAKFLAVLESQSLRRLGSERWIDVDVRIVAASNRKQEELRSGSILRLDLYYRLTMNSIDVPPLRERPADIPPLIEHFLAEFNEANGTNLSLHPDVIATICALPLLGNSREIRNIVWQIGVDYAPESDPLMRVTVPAKAAFRFRCTADQSATNGSEQGERQIYRNAADEIEAEELAQLAEECEGNVYELAEKLGVHRTTVIRKLHRYGIPYTRRHKQKPD